MRTRAPLFTLSAGLVAALVWLPSGPAAAAGSAVEVAPNGLDIRAVVLDIAVQTSDLDGAVDVTRTGATARVTLDADVLFAFYRADLSPAADSRLAETASALTASTGPVPVDGYTDAQGSAPYNQQLSERRAAAVADALRTRAPAAAARLTATGHGSADPVAPNSRPDGSDDPAGRAKNRRVTVTYAVGGGR